MLSLIDFEEFKTALHHKANLAFDDGLLQRLLQEYDDDGSGQIDFRKFCNNVLGSKVGDADCVTKTKPTGSKNVVSSDAGNSDHFLRRKIRLAAKDIKLAFKAMAYKNGDIPVHEWRSVLTRFGTLA